MPSIADLPSLLEGLDPAARSDVERVLRVREHVGLGEVPEPLRAKVARWCGGAATAAGPAREEQQDAASEAWRRAERQRVVSVHCLWTFQTANFNVLRASRPVGAGHGAAARRGPEELAAACEGPELCDFCDLERLTCVEPFGRVCGKHSATAGNVFKSAGLHGLVIWRQHRLHLLTPDELRDGLETADAWLGRAADWDAARAEGRGAADLHPVAFWNCFGSGGASQIHPHMQLQLVDAPVAQEALLLEQCRRYRQAAAGASSDGGLVADLARAHARLGLALEDPPDGAAACWASLTPSVGGGEFCALGAEGAAAPAWPRLAALAPALGVMMGALRRCGAEGISVVACLAPVDGGARASWLLRCANRGRAEAQVSDAGSAELGGLTGVGSDPFLQLAALREELSERAPCEVESQQDAKAPVAHRDGGTECQRGSPPKRQRRA